MLPTEKTYTIRHVRRVGSGDEGGAYTPDTGAAWEERATDIPALIQWISGSVQNYAAGRDLNVTAKLLVNPGDMPAGDFIFQGDGIEIIEGPVLSGSGRFIVQTANPIGEPGAFFDDEFLLEDTAEAFE
jgi:hypothetical protein